MSTPPLVGHQSRYDLRVFPRDRRARAFILPLPVVMLSLLFGVPAHHVHLRRDNRKRERLLPAAHDRARPGRAALSNMLITLVANREPARSNGAARPRSGRSR